MALHKEDVAESQRWEKGKDKRCKAMSAQGMRCEKRRGHVHTDQKVTHMQGPWIWHEDARKDELSQPPSLFAPVADPEFVSVTFASDLPSPSSPQFSPAETELRGWWFDLAEEEINRTVPKAIEYSSTDLVDLGRTLAYIAGRDVEDEEAEELGVFFYLAGKMSRWAGAIKSGRRVSDDTLFDIGVYVRMTQRIRHAGNWPGIQLDPREGTE